MSRNRFLRLGRPLSLLSLAALGGCDWTVLDPKGQIGADERSIILFATGLMLIVVVPVILMTIGFAWKYRASNARADYAPHWAHSTKIETVVWLVPCAIIATLAYVTWTSSHKLDPYRPIASAAKPVTIEAVALDWKWLFIYPDLGIAAVNQIAFPAGVPVDFRITSGSVMNSFAIPQLGGQVYAMLGMETKLHLIADEAGSYDGMSANFSGGGFSGMNFKALAMSEGDFERWVARVKGARRSLDATGYKALARPSEDNPVAYYASVDPQLYHAILMKCFVGADAACGAQTAMDHAAMDHMAMGKATANKAKD